jgi:hypothetical protein
MWRSLSLSFVICAACGSGSSSTGSAESFLTGLPSRQTLEVSAPSGHAPAALTTRSAALLGETASLYVLTRQTTGQVNGIVGGVLDTLGKIASTPPSAVGPDSAGWGPFTDALSPVAGRLIIHRTGPGTHDFRVDLRPKSGSDADFKTFLLGTSTGATPHGPSEGSFSVDLTLAHTLDPVANPVDGQLVARWNAGADRRDVHVHFTDVHAGPDAPANADVNAIIQADGSGSLAFDAQANLLGSPDTIETGKVRSRWTASGAGRGDVEVHDTDAGDGFLVTECWDSSFGRVYARGQTPDGGVASEGEVSACAFSEPLR